MGDRAGDGDDLVHLASRRPRPARPHRHPYGADRLAPHPRRLRGSSGCPGWSPGRSRSGRRSCDTHRTRAGTGGQGPNDRSLDLAALDPDFAEYYDDAPTGAPAVLRAPTPLGRRAGGPAPDQPPAEPASPPPQPTPATPADPVRRRPARRRRSLTVPGSAAPAPGPRRRPPAAIGPEPVPTKQLPKRRQQAGTGQPGQAGRPPAGWPAGAPGSPAPRPAFAAHRRRDARPATAHPAPEYKDSDPVAELVITEIAGT